MTRKLRPGEGERQTVRDASASAKAPCGRARRVPASPAAHPAGDGAALPLPLPASGSTFTAPAADFAFGEGFALTFAGTLGTSPPALSPDALARGACRQAAAHASAMQGDPLPDARASASAYARAGLVGYDDAAARLGIGRRTLERLVAGRVVCPVRIGRRVLFDGQALDDYGRSCARFGPGRGNVRPQAGRGRR